MGGKRLNRWFFTLNLRIYWEKVIIFNFYYYLCSRKGT